MAHALLGQERTQLSRRSRPSMKKLLTLLFTGMIAFSLAMPVFAQDTGAQETTKATKAKKTKATKEKKTKAKKTTGAAPTQ